MTRSKGIQIVPLDLEIEHSLKQKRKERRASETNTPPPLPKAMADQVEKKTSTIGSSWSLTTMRMEDGGLLKPLSLN